jgi:hypothetical protein
MFRAFNGKSIAFFEGPFQLALNYAIFYNSNFTSMKSILLFLSVLVSLQAFGQKKGKEDPQDSIIDSLTSVTNTQKVLNDSLAAASSTYFGVYTSLRDKVFTVDFNPSRTSAMLDSIITTRGSLQSATVSGLQDSLNIMIASNKALKSKLDSLTAVIPVKPEVPQEELEQAAAVAALRELKSLLDAGIISQTEFVTLKKKYLSKL